MDSWSDLTSSMMLSAERPALLPGMEEPDPTDLGRAVRRFTLRRVECAGVDQPSHVLLIDLGLVRQLLHRQ
jgi:hypothetical protein